VVQNLWADKGVELMALDGEITTQIIKHFTDRAVPILTVHDSYIVESSREQELMDVMQSVTREVVGNHKFKMKQEQLSPNMIQTFTNQDKQINAMDGYKSITSSITRTSGYNTRYKAFQKYLEDYPLA
jgi:flagellar motor switch protein FliG